MELKKAALSDLKDLQEICAESYTQVFANHWTANGLALYLVIDKKRENWRMELSAKKPFE